MKYLHIKNWGLLTLALFISVPLLTQNPVAYITVTTTHWNLGYEDGTPKDWMALEKEYHEKVIMKNEHIMHAQFLNHYYTADNSEVVLVTAYGSWADIEKAPKRNVELSEAAWPDKAEREAFFDKKDAYYQNRHSDEIYATQPNFKALVLDSTNMDESMVYYVQKLHTVWPDDGTEEEIMALHKQYLDVTVHNNPAVRAYYEYNHAWGSDKREYVQVRVFGSLAEIEAYNAGVQKLLEANWPDEEKRNEFFDNYDKYFTGWHGDFIYRNVPSLRK